MLKLRSEPVRTPLKLKLRLPSVPKMPRVRRAAWLLVVPALVIAFEGYRGHQALKKWTDEMSAKGEVFDASHVWPAPSAQTLELSNQLLHATQKLSPSLGNYAVDISGMVVSEYGEVRRGSLEPQPASDYFKRGTNTWAELDEAVKASRPTLQSLVEILTNPPSALNADIMARLAANTPPNLSSSRIGSQAFHAAAMNDLHNGDLELVAQDLGGIMAFAKLHDQDPSLINYMISVAIVGLSVDAFWDALHAPGWTEAQLAALQKQCLDTSAMVKRLPRALEAERASRLFEYNWFRGHSYQAWYDRYQKQYGNFGIMPADSYQTWMRAHTNVSWVSFYRKLNAQFGWRPPTESVAPWQQWLLHPLWSMACADQEELEYLQRIQPDIEVLRETAKHPSLRRLNQQMAENHKKLEPPEGAWRYYWHLPFADNLSQNPGNDKFDADLIPFADYSHAWELALKNLTLHQLVITAIAIKRYELAHGKNPNTLDALVPNLLPVLPTDFMDGQPLRYQRHPDNTFTLYSVGRNLRDDGGDPRPELVGSSGHREPPPWNGDDWVWPRATAAPKTTNSPAAILQSRSQ